MKLTSKQLLYSGIALLVVLIGIGWWFYHKGKKTTTIAAIPNDTPEGANNSAGVSLSQISQIADALYTDMDGFNWAGHDSQPYQDFESLSDTDFVKVYNTFNTKHQSEGNGTLKKWIEDEDYAFDDVVDSILSRMGRLNLL